MTRTSWFSGVVFLLPLGFDLAPSIRTSKVCAVSFPYLIYIAGLALSDLIGLTRLSWVSLLVSPNQCGEWAFAPALSRGRGKEVFDLSPNWVSSLLLTPLLYHNLGGLSRGFLHFFSMTGTCTKRFCGSVPTHRVDVPVGRGALYLPLTPIV